jgi:hypothetical protein
MDTTETHWSGRRLITAGAVVGLVGGVVFSAMMIALHGPERRWVALKLAAYPFLGDRVMRPGFDAAAVTIGVLGHLAVAVTWGVLFALLVYRLSRPMTVLLGAVWGVVVWLVMFALVLRIIAPRLAEGGGAFGNVVIHMIFGLSLAVAFLPFQRPSFGSQRRWHSQSVSAAHAGRPAGPVTWI